MNDEQNLTPEFNTSGGLPDEALSAFSDDDLRYAPPSETQAEPEAETNDALAEAELLSDDAATLPVTEGLDIEAALAAVSSLSDMVAEQEAAEQAHLAEQQAAAEAQAERQARMENPERFFALPGPTSLQRGQLASVVPALLLIVIGAWLTFTLTTSKTLPDAGLLSGVTVGSAALILLARWLSSGRWARGTLLFALSLLLGSGVMLYLSQPVSPGLQRGWPLVIAAFGLAIILSAFLGTPREGRLAASGVLLFAAGLAGLAVTLPLLADSFLASAGSLWPGAVALIAVLLLLPRIFRQRR